MKIGLATHRLFGGAGERHESERGGVSISPELYSEFILEYRLTSVQWGAYGGLLAAGAFCLFAVVSFLEGHSFFSLLVRVGLVVLLLSGALVFLLFRGFAAKNYVLIAGSLSAGTLFATLFLIHEAPELIVSPAIMFGLFLHYSCLRLPLGPAAAIGWSAGVIGAFVTPIVYGGDQTLRGLIYVALGNVIGMLVSWSQERRERDLFFQKREAENARAEARDRAAAAEEANRQKARLVAAVSHDLRQPMMAAVTHLDLLRSRLDDDDVLGARVQAGRAEKAVGALGATLDHLLVAARYDSGREAIQIEMVDLASLARRVRDEFDVEASSKGLQFRLRLPKRRVLANTDTQSLYRVMSNLVSNAIKFTESNARPGRGIILRVRFLHGRCRIDVVDTGVGIAPKHRQEVWEPYVQINASERNREKGLGLGLFLVRQIIDQLPGHSIDMYSTPGRGSRFTVDLPGVTVAESRVMPLQSDRDSPQIPLDKRALRGGYVLLIEDDHEARLALQDLLDEWGLLYASGATLREVLAFHSDSDRLVDAIICDYRLPAGSTGVECIAHLRVALGYSPKAIIISGESDPDAIREQNSPDTLVFQKPFRSLALASALVDAIRTMRESEAVGE